jgi:hypothetical protein
MDKTEVIFTVVSFSLMILFVYLSVIAHIGFALLAVIALVCGMSQPVALVIEMHKTPKSTQLTK